LHGFSGVTLNPSLNDGGQIHLLGKGSKARTVRVSTDTLQLFESLGRAGESDYLFPSSRTKSHLTRQAINYTMRKWGQKAGVDVHPHKLRHSHATHAIRRGTNVFCLQHTLGHSSTDTTSGYVKQNPEDSSSLALG
jgi:site-specific recombinase XerD